MPRISKTLALTETTSTTLTTILPAVPAGINTSIAVITFTNLSTDNHEIDIYVNNGTSDFLLHTITLPGGVGIRRLDHGFQRTVFNAGFLLKIQSDSASAFNTWVCGSEVEV